MKCQFDGFLKSQDTVFMNLYKRVFPKWTYRSLTVQCLEDKQTSFIPVKDKRETMEQS